MNPNLHRVAEGEVTTSSAAVARDDAVSPQVGLKGASAGGTHTSNTLFLKVEINNAAILNEAKETEISASSASGTSLAKGIVKMALESGGGGGRDRKLFNSSNCKLEDAGELYMRLNVDIQKYIKEEFITPQLSVYALVNKFDILIENEDCQQLKYDCLIPVLEDITAQPAALRLMCEKDTLGFRDVYKKHLIDHNNTFRLVTCPITSMAMEFVMRKWH